MKPIKAFLLVAIVYLTAEVKMKTKTKELILDAKVCYEEKYKSDAESRCRSDRTSYNAIREYSAYPYKSIGPTWCETIYNSNNGKYRSCYKRMERTQHEYCSTIKSECESRRDYNLNTACTYSCTVDSTFACYYCYDRKN